MATTSQWVEGARPRTLPAAVSPVVAGTGIALAADDFVWWKALLALVVALALQVAVNYANDYSDGVRGTDARRVGPLRLVGSGAATPAKVRAAALAAFGVAAVTGFVLAATSAWWLLAVGAATMAAAWFYTGGSRPYGYRGLGEVSVLVFFGLVATVGTAFVQTGSISKAAVLAGLGVGCLACALLVANNLRDIPTDQAAGKRTLAVLLGERRSRLLYVALLTLAFALGVGVSALLSWWALLAFVAVPLAVPATRTVLGGATGLRLIPVLRATGLLELGYAIGLCVGLLVGAG